MVVTIQTGTWLAFDGCGCARCCGRRCCGCCTSSRGASDSPTTTTATCRCSASPTTTVWHLLRLTDVGGLQVHLAEGMCSRHRHRVLQSGRATPRTLQQRQFVELLGQVGFRGGRWWRLTRRRMSKVMGVELLLLLGMWRRLGMMMVVVMPSSQLGLQGVLFLEQLTFLLQQSVLQELLLQRRLLHR